MSRLRAMRRAARASFSKVGDAGTATRRFAQAVGVAVAEYAAGGASLDQTCYGLMRFAAQCAKHGGATDDEWSKIAAKAWGDEAAVPEPGGST